MTLGRYLNLAGVGVIAALALTACNKPADKPADAAAPAADAAAPAAPAADATPAPAPNAMAPAAKDNGDIKMNGPDSGTTPPKPNN